MLFAAGFFVGPAVALSVGAFSVEVLSVVDVGVCACPATLPMANGTIIATKEATATVLRILCRMFDFIFQPTYPL